MYAKFLYYAFTFTLCAANAENAVLAITDDGVKNLQAGLSNLEYLYEHKGQERLQILLLNLDKPINRIATQLSDLHDKLERGLAQFCG